MDDNIELDSIVDDVEADIFDTEVVRFELTDDVYIESVLDSDEWNSYCITDAGEEIEKNFNTNIDEPIYIGNNITISKEDMIKFNDIKQDFIKEL